MSGPARQVRQAWKRATTGWRQAAIDRTPVALREPLAPLAAYADMLFVDHGIFRLIYLNKHRLSADALRSAQPSPAAIGRLARSGVRTIVNLRGTRESGSYWLETRACERHGIKLVNYTVRSRAAPSKEELRGARDLFQRIEYPILMHCKSGADRAGFFAALYLLVHEKRPLAEATAELSFRYGHFRFAKTGILDAFFEAYAREGASRDVAFLDWVAKDYDPDRLEREFKPGFFSSLLADRLIRRE